MILTPEEEAQAIENILTKLIYLIPPPPILEELKNNGATAYKTIIPIGMLMETHAIIRKINFRRRTTPSNN